jgi:hypothetical protein
MSENLIVPTMAEIKPKENNLKYCFVGCAGSFDDRAKKITKAFVHFNRANVPLQYLVLKRVAGDPAKKMEMSSCFKCKQ